MAYLGYDSGLVLALRDALLAAADGLALVRSSDPSAADAMQVVRSCRTALDTTWAPVLDELLCCRTLEDALPIRLDGHDIRSAPLLAGQRSGWTIRRDPGGAATASKVALVAEARAIGAGLLDESITDEMTGAELAWLAERLRAIATVPEAAAAFRVSVGGAKQWSRVLDQLGLDRLARQSTIANDPRDHDAQERLDRLDDAFGAIGAVYAAGTHSGRRPAAYPAVLSDVEPYTAALLAPHLGLDAHVAARAAHDILERWMGWPGDRQPADFGAGGPDAPDLLFQWLATDGAASFELLRLCTEQPQLVLRTAHEPAVEAVLAAGTSAATHSVEQVGTVIPPLIGWAARYEDVPGTVSGGGLVHPHTGFATLLAPWLLQLTSRADEWAWRPGEADDALRWVITDGDAAELLVARMDEVQSQLSEMRFVDDDGVVIASAVDDIAGMFAALELAFRDEERRDALSKGFWLDAGLMVVNGVLTAFGPEGFVAGAALDLAVGPVARKLLGELGLDGSKEAADADARFGSRTADLQLTAVIAVTGGLIEMGRLPADALDRLDVSDLDGSGCTARTVDDRITEFRESLAAALDPASLNAIYAVQRAFANEMSILQQC
jgi:hypothetical protein